MTMIRVFTSFDFDHDEDLKNLLIGQSKNQGSPFEMADWSVKEPLSGNWKEKVRSRLRQCHLVIVVCGEHTDRAHGVNEELRIAREEGIPYFLLWGRNGKACTKPTAARETDKVYRWTWDNLRTLLAGTR